MISRGSREIGHRPPRQGACAAILAGAAIVTACGAADGTDPSPSDLRFATRVVSFTPGNCAGFGAEKMPNIVLGAPAGDGTASGGVDVVSLGSHGEIVLSVEPNAIVDGDGADFVVFENAFLAGGDPSKPYVELGEVSVSDDGNSWKAFPCVTAGFPYPGCAGVHPVLASRENGISPTDPAQAGGDAFDLKELGVAHARFIRIRDLGTVACSDDPSARFPTGGFDLDAIAVVHGEK